ncbi:WD40-repeat-containing domain protein [Baffinella frigidus]|nr:WD40-repeat-containing domain protein [Cryptophyta sp. CCMP2293]
MGQGQSGFELTGHSKAVYACSCSEDGQLLLSASGDGLLKLWDLTTLKAVRDFTGHTCAVYSCAISASGELAVSGALDGTVKVWRVSTGEEAFSFTVGDSGLAVMTVSFSPDGTCVLAGGADKTAVIWELALGEDSVSGEPVATLAGHKLAINAATFTFDGESVVTGSSDSTVKIWGKLSTLKEVRTLSGHRAAVMAVDVTRDGTLVLSASQDHTVCVWAAATGNIIKVLKGHSDAVRACKFSRDGTMIVTGAYDHRVMVFVRAEEGNEWQRACKLQKHTRGVTSCTFSADGMVLISGIFPCLSATRSWDKTVRLTPIEDVRTLAVFPPPEAGEHPQVLASALHMVPESEALLASPALLAACSDLAKMVGVARVKAKLAHLIGFLLRHRAKLGSRNMHCNMLLFGQQGTGKYHLARLIARVIVSGGFLRHPGGGEGSALVTRREGAEEDAPLVFEPLVLCRASKLKASTPEGTAANFKAFLEKHRGHVIMLKELDALAETAPAGSPPQDSTQ